MSNHILSLFFAATGGRPMRLIRDVNFMDKKTGKVVGLYCDRHKGDYWLADGPWSRQRFRQPGAASRTMPIPVSIYRGSDD